MPTRKSAGPPNDEAGRQPEPPKTVHNGPARVAAAKARRAGRVAGTTPLVAAKHVKHTAAVVGEKHPHAVGAFTAAESVLDKQVNGFIDFLREQSVVGLAVGLVLGTQIKQLVDQLIASFVNPLIGLFLPGKGALSEQQFTLSFGGKHADFAWGAFVLSLLTFILVAACVYGLFKLLKLDRLAKKKEG